MQCQCTMALIQIALCWLMRNDTPCSPSELFSDLRSDELAFVCRSLVAHFSHTVRFYDFFYICVMLQVAFTYL